MKQALIYNELVRFYNRSRRKLQSLAIEGKNLRKQNILQKRIVRLFKTLTGMQRALKLGMATAALSAGMLLFQPNLAQAQSTFNTVQTNPFSLTYIDLFSAPAFVDLDNDGDIDLMAGDWNGNFRYFQNTGTASSPAFAALQTNPFGLTNVGFRAHPAFADLDSDGDMDLISPGASISFKYFQNTGTASAPAFAAFQDNPFGLTSPVNFCAPSLADLDNDGDMDLIAGETFGNFRYFRNIGTAAAPAFDVDQFNPFGLTGIGHYSAPAFVDLDNDGDMDLIAGEFYGNFKYFQNTGTAAVPAFGAVQTNPFDLSDIGRYSFPTLTDLDNDGDLDLVAGEFYGGFKYFEAIPCNGFILYADDDGDGYGDLNSSINVADCSAPAGYVKDKTDCNDGDPAVHPGAEELINGLDNNCNGIIDDVAQNTWIQKADFGGSSRTRAVGFSIGSKGYIGTGSAYFGGFQKDFWEYDPATNVWTQKANFGGTFRTSAVGFSIGSKGYIGTGNASDGIKKDFWEYDPSANNWTQKADFGGSARQLAVGFSIGEKGYVGTGYNIVNGSSVYFKDFWEYDPVSNSWAQKSDFGGNGTFIAVGFSIGEKGYIGTGYATSDITNNFWEYDPNTDSWTQKASFGGTARTLAVGFGIGSKGYIGTGIDIGLTNDFWEYDPDTNTWTQKANSGGPARSGAVGFSIGTKGYMGTGSTFPYSKDFWVYTPDTSSCPVPSNLSVTNITNSSAKLKWDAVAGAEGYTVRYKISHSTEWKYRTTNGTLIFMGGLLPSTEYKWEIKTFCQIAPNVTSDWSSKQTFTTGLLRIGDESVQQVSFQIYPNPAEAFATIQFTLPQTSHVSIKVFDVSGKEIATLLDAELQQGEHTLHINTNHFSKGVYMVRMVSDFGIENQKLIVQ